MDLDLNGLFAEWLEQQHMELTQKGSKLAYAYSRALDKINSHEGPISTPRELKAIQYVGDKIVKLLCSRLKKHCKENSLPIPAAFENYVEADNGGKRILELDDDNAKKKARRSNWIPKRRSGSWAILVALYLKDRAKRGLRKEEIIEAATPHCDGSFTSNPAARDFYSAWDGVKTLINRELVTCSGRPKIYVITDAGAQMARVLTQEDPVESEPGSPEMSFDNGLRVSSPTKPSPRRSLFMSSQSSQNTQDSQSQSKSQPNLQSEQTSKSITEHDVANRVFNGTKYDIWSPEEFEIVLLLDNREIRSITERDFFHTRVVANGVTSEVRALAVGDVLWIARHKTTKKEVVLNYVCERKRLDDLAMSIRDGRFTEQKNRLRKSGINNVHYLVEEGGLGDVQRIMDMKKAIETAISMVITVSNFSMQRFRRVDDTIAWLVRMTSILTARYSEYKLVVLRPQCVNSQDEYLDLLLRFRSEFEGRTTRYECVHTFPVYKASLEKTSMMTVKEMFVLMLMSVRGISFEKAVMIQQRFQTPRKLIEFYLHENKHRSEAEKEMLIMDLFGDQYGGKKIHKVASIAMYEAWGKE